MDNQSPLQEITASAVLATRQFATLISAGVSVVHTLCIL